MIDGLIPTTGSGLRIMSATPNETTLEAYSVLVHAWDYEQGQQRDVMILYKAGALRELALKFCEAATELDKLNGVLPT